MTGILTFGRLGKHGNLGNQLWEIGSVMGIAHRNKMAYAFPKWKYADYFVKALPFTDKQIANRINEKQYHYEDMVIKSNQDTDLLGWFQSEKYFDKIKHLVRGQFGFKPAFLSATLKKQLQKLNGHQLCAISVRRGDYVGNPNYAQLGMNYYIGATRLMPKGCKFVVFSDDIDWCKNQFPEDFIFIEDHTAIEQLAMMSLCHHFIIANSSFSWWGAWLGEKKDSVIVAPHVWNAGPLLATSDDRDVVPDRWIKYNPLAPTEKIDLMDVTFTIPIRIDHPDRLENFNTSITYLNNHFKTNILVMECDVYGRLEPDDGYEYMFDKSQLFHRTRLLNIMARAATTPIIVNWDADVFIAPQQLHEAIQMIRDKKADCCYPYDGRFLRVNREHLSEFTNVLNVELFRGMKFKKHDMVTESFGGAVCWNKTQFFAGGGENENFIDYGPEDWERVYRFKKLGFKVDRVKGPLFHIDHNIVSQQHNNRRPNANEYVRIRSLSQEQLKEEVKAWKR